tara:strand:- start:35 stop:853 length:819 start_codon:yes stop_codon:yes gene_type:complete
MTDTFNLSGKIVLITGAAGLLGRQHAEAVMNHGGSPIIADINVEAATQFASYLNDKFDTSRAYAEYINVIDKDTIIKVCNKYEKIDVLINNAAKDTKVEKADDLNLDARFETMSYQYWKEDMQVGLDGCFLCSQVVANKMLQNGGGSIINIASDLSVFAPDQRIYMVDGLPEEKQYVKPATYSVSKWAILGLTKYMATYFAHKNIRVNSLSPAGLYNPDLPDEFVSRLTSLIPMRRMGNANEYSGAVVFLCSEASKYMTGQNIIMDGGRSVW